MTILFLLLLKIMMIQLRKRHQKRKTHLLPFSGTCRTTFFKQILKLSTPTTLEVKHKTSLHPKQVKMWFQNSQRKLKLDKTLAAPVLEYDLIEDLKKLRANISVFELLKFPLILQKMLQSIAENSKKNDVSSKKSAEIDLNKAKNVPSKKTSENQDKRDFIRKNCRKLR
jgi:hypothetical protein